jgi:hypothetical protein
MNLADQQLLERALADPNFERLWAGEDQPFADEAAALTLCRMLVNLTGGKRHRVAALLAMSGHARRADLIDRAMAAIQDWCRRYRSLGFALARIRPGQKQPTEKDWTSFSAEPEDFGPADSVGIQGGARSGDLVCVDLDSRLALDLADEYLPRTGMVEGRPGKPRSHRWYRVTNIPTELTADPDIAGGAGGPRTRRGFRTPDGSTNILDFQGTGAQAVVPPSVWTKHGRLEIRTWDSFEAPAIVDCQELFNAVSRLAEACGWQPPVPAARTPRTPAARPDEVAHLPMTRGEIAYHARKYLAKMAPAVQGKGGNQQTFRVACVLVLDFDLTVQDALPIFCEWNRRCQPPWSVAELEAKLNDADNKPGTRGGKVRPRRRVVNINIRPGDPVVYVGVDCAAPSRSYIDLSPSLWAGVLDDFDGRQLAPELAEVDWHARRVVLTPPSNIMTNKQEVWGEFFLARLLRQHGAEVKSVRLTDFEGRKRTFNQAEPERWNLVDPPDKGFDAHLQAEEAANRAKQLDAYRKSLPRKKSSPKLEKAVDLVHSHNITALTREALTRAREQGIGQKTLQKAILQVRTAENMAA